MTTPKPAALPERFTKKPVTIEAVRFTEALRDAIVLDGAPCPEGVKRGATTWHQKDRKIWRADFFIDTLEGRMNVEVGDWIIKGVKGEFYPCKPDIFEMTYDRAALQSQPAACAPTAHIKEPYTLAELNARIASNDYNAELLLQHAMLLLNAQPAAAGVSDEPEQASKVVNDSCWKFIDAMPHKIPGPIWNDLKPAIYAALIHYHRAILALRPQSYPLPDDLYDSKDWRQGNYASRVEWLHTMYEHAKHERDEYAAQLEALRPQAVPMTDKPEWIVNDLGELGVRVGSRFFFLYKGGNIEYGADGIGDSRGGVALHEDGTPMQYRIVGKREFGETCWPLKWVVRGHSERRYTEPLTFIPGLSWGKPEDGEWKPLPALGITAQGALGEQA